MLFKLMIKQSFQNNFLLKPGWIYNSPFFDLSRDVRMPTMQTIFQ